MPHFEASALKQDSVRTLLRLPPCSTQIELYNSATSSSFSFTVWFRLRRGNGARMQHKPGGLGSFVWFRVVDRPGICVRADASVRMFTQGKLSEKYTVIAEQIQQARVHCTARHMT